MRRLPAPLLLLGGLLALYLAAPLAAGLFALRGADWRGADLPAIAHAALVSLGSATAATVLVTLGGVPLGYALARARGGWLSGAAGVLVQMPLALPPLASGVLLLFLFGYDTPLGRLAGGGLTDSFAGVVLAEAFVAAPFLVVAARSAFAAVDPQLEAMAATLGHPPGAVFRRVALPVAARAVLAGALLAWLRAFGEFGATVMVAYHPYTLPVLTYVAFGSEGLPAMLPLLLPTLLAATAVLAAGGALARRRVRQRPVAAPLPAPAPLVPDAGGTGVAGPDAAPSAAAPDSPARTLGEDPLPRPAIVPRAVGPVASGRGPGPGDAPSPPTLSLVLCRRLPGFALDVRWEARSRRLAILGASGSGKSSTLRAIAGLDRRAEDQVALDGRPLGALPPHRRGAALVPQDYALLPHLPVARQMRFAAGAEEALAARWTSRLGLEGLEGRLPEALSLGQRQRVALGRALARPDSAALLLDEPFSALDAALRRRLCAEMLRLQREAGLLTVLVTHDPGEAALLADEVLLLRRGAVLGAGPVSALFARPGSEAAARLLGAELIGRARAVPGGMDLGGACVALPAPHFAEGAELGWSVRPHQMRLVAAGTAGALPGEVLRLGPVRDGQREAVLRLGRSVLAAQADPGGPGVGACGVLLDGGAMQVWGV